MTASWPPCTGSLMRDGHMAASGEDRKRGNEPDIALTIEVARNAVGPWDVPQKKGSQTEQEQPVPGE